MIRIRHGLAAALAVTLVQAGVGGLEAAEQEGPDMQSFVWKNRPVVVLAPTPDDPLVADQASRLSSHGAGLAERDMVVITVAGSEVRIDGKPAAGMDAEAVRTRFGVTRDERAVLLIGKDGGVKLRRDTAVDPHALFALIDTMPMRRREMREDD